MKARLAASAVLAFGVIVGATGCSMITPQATLIHYDASDGFSVTLGDIAVRNALIVSDNGEQGNLVLTAANSGSIATTLSVEVAGETQRIDLAAGEQIVFGEELDYTEPLQFDNIDAQPGALVPVFFSAPGAESIQESIPVLDSRLPEYSHLAP